MGVVIWYFYVYFSGWRLVMWIFLFVRRFGTVFILDVYCLVKIWGFVFKEGAMGIGVDSGRFLREFLCYYFFCRLLIFFD